MLGVDPEKKRISLSIRQVLEPEVPAAEEAPASEAEYEIVATDDTVAEQFAEAVEGVAEAAEEKAEEKVEEAAEAVAEAVEEKTEE